MLGAWCMFVCWDSFKRCDRKKEKRATSGESRKIYVHMLANNREVPPHQWCVNGGYFCPTIEHKKLRANFVDVAFKGHGDWILFNWCLSSEWRGNIFFFPDDHKGWQKNTWHERPKNSTFHWCNVDPQTSITSHPPIRRWFDGYFPDSWICWVCVFWIDSLVCWYYFRECFSIFTGFQNIFCLWQVTRDSHCPLWNNKTLVLGFGNRHWKKCVRDWTKEGF